MTDRPASEHIIQRVCELWVRQLRNIKYDNGDRSAYGALTQAIASQLRPTLSDDDLERFRIELAKLLRDGVETQYGRHYTRYLGVDYDPDRILHAAAVNANLNIRGKAWPWKTTISFYGDYIGVSAGYAAPEVNHYPLIDGRWLICRLCGDDIDKIINQAERGEGGWTVEAAMVQS